MNLLLFCSKPHPYTHGLPEARALCTSGESTLSLFLFIKLSLQELFHRHSVRDRGHSAFERNIIQAESPVNF